MSNKINWKPETFGNHLAVHWAMEQREFLYREGGTTHDLVVLMTIASHMSHDAWSGWLSNATVAREALCNVRSVQRSVANLVDFKKLRIVGQHASGANMYKLTMDSESR